MFDAELVEDAGHDEIDQVARRADAWYQPGEAGRTTAPASVTRRMLSMWASESGVSRGTRISLRRSLRWTSAARWIKFDAAPVATALSVEPLQGQITMPAVMNDPLAMGAVKSGWW